MDEDLRRLQRAHAKAGNPPVIPITAEERKTISEWLTQLTLGHGRGHWRSYQRWACSDCHAITTVTVPFMPSQIDMQHTTDCVQVARINVLSKIIERLEDSSG